MRTFVNGLPQNERPLPGDIYSFAGILFMVIAVKPNHVCVGANSLRFVHGRRARYELADDCVDWQNGNVR